MSSLAPSGISTRSFDFVLWALEVEIVVVVADSDDGLMRIVR